MLNSSLLRINLGRNVTPTPDYPIAPVDAAVATIMVNFHHEWLLEGMQLSASPSRCAYVAHFRAANDREIECELEKERH